MKGGRVVYPARYFTPKNAETYKGGGLIRDLVNGVSSLKNVNPANTLLKVYNGQNKLGFKSSAQPLSNDYQENKQYINQDGGNAYLNTISSRGPINTSSMSKAQFEMFNTTAQYMTNDELAPGAVDGKAACWGKTDPVASNSYNGVATGGGKKMKVKSRKKRKSRKKIKSLKNRKTLY